MFGKNQTKHICISSFFIMVMVKGLDTTKEEKRKHGLMEEKDYITEAYLQGGKAIGEILTKKKKKK